MIAEYKEIILQISPNCTTIVMENINGFHGIAVVNRTLMYGLQDSFTIKTESFFSKGTVIRTRIRPLDIFRLFKVDLYVFHDAIAYNYISPVKGFLIKFIQGIYVKRADRVVCISHHAKSELNKYHPFVDDGRIHVVHNKIGCVDNKSLDYYLWVGSMKSHKRLDRLIDIARQRPDLNFVCVLPSVVNFTESNIHVISSVPSMIMARLFREANGVICTSEDEGFYLPFQEALAEATPCIGLNISVFRELYTDNEAVKLYNSIEELALSL
jgi:glycosyltransferase involved in cell wall biosynthesis